MSFTAILAVLVSSNCQLFLSMESTEIDVLPQQFCWPIFHLFYLPWITSFPSIFLSWAAFYLSFWLVSPLHHHSGPVTSVGAISDSSSRNPHIHPISSTSRLLHHVLPHVLAHQQCLSSFCLNQAYFGSLAIYWIHQKIFHPRSWRIPLSLCSQSLLIHSQAASLLALLVYSWFDKDDLSLSTQRQGWYLC